MKKEQQIHWIHTVFEGLEKQQKKEDADGITYQIEAKKYTSEERFIQEKSLIFQNHPIVTGPAAQLQNPGDYFLHDLTDMPLIIIKGRDGIIRAFLNMCRHRGVRLLEKPEGNIRANIICPYHAWAYDTQGCLKGIFHAQGFQDVNADSHRLIELDAWVRMGLVFVVPNPDLRGKFDIDEWLKEAYAITEGFEFGEMIPYHVQSGKLACNWKLIIDGALEGYHFKIAHSKTIGKYFLDNMSVNTENRLHSSIIFPKRSMKKIQELPTDKWELRANANVLLHIFPSTIILIEPDHMMVVTVFPDGATYTKTRSFMLLPSEPDTPKKKQYWDLNADIFWNAINEDNEMAVWQQKSFNGFDRTTMTVGSYEKLLVQFENLVDGILEGSHQLS